MFEQVLSEKTRKLLFTINDEINKYDFYLGGGSGLALYIGHRVSEDLDFFTLKDFKPEQLARYLETNYQYQEVSVSSVTLHCTINEVKVSFMRYLVPLFYPLTDFAKIKVADWRDILAEKFKTLSQRGSKKDFYDIYCCYLYNKLNIGEGIKFLKHRFKKTEINYYHILKSLVYFEDADQEPELMLIKPVPWQTVKDFFIRNIREFEKHLLEEESLE
ncbi:MAG: nucleotidyl transferase AbiEii/AbiGii toxin family protein [candidate division WOR-3 bacterium]|nr:nucleotidyl transferase AbiEii/AbiGii toxin family protein [candidate division WOR-3 bacterium]